MRQCQVFVLLTLDQHQHLKVAWKDYQIRVCALMGVRKWCLLGAYLSIKDSAAELGQSFIQSNLFIVKSLIRENDYLLFTFAPTTAPHS